jgi:hypothetical protein
MSYDFIVYTLSSQIPEPARLAAELSSRAPWLGVPPSFDLREASGYVPLATTGFEIWLEPITAAEIEDHKEALKEAGEPDDDHLAILQGCDTSVMFNCKDDREISAARIVAGALAALSGGFLCDPQKGVTVAATYLPE